jgi:hypothetical protein
MDEMILALNALKEALIQGKGYEVLNSPTQEILNANIAELSDIMVRYCKDNYDV